MARSDRDAGTEVGADGPPEPPLAPDRELAGMGDVTVAPPARPGDLDARRAAVAELGDALRALTANAIATEVDADVLRRVAVEARALAATLAERRHPPGHPSSVDDLGRGQRPFNPVVGAGNPVAPPMRIEIVDGVAIGTCTLDARYEGPLTFAHGGISALLLDQVMGYAAAAHGHPSLTGRLQIRYRTAVPLDRELRVEGRFVDVLGVRAAIRGRLSLAEAPDEVLVEADGSFLALRPEQAARLFGRVDPPPDA